MSLKQKYFRDRNFYLNQNNSRDHMAQREIETLSLLLKYSYDFNLCEGLNILDLGAGDKFLKNEILKRKCKYFSLDINDLDFEKDKFNFENDRFDIVISLSVLEHLRDPSKFMSEILRVLKINGFIYLETPNWTYCKDIFYDDPTHQRPYTPKALENLLKIYEFKDIIITPNLRCKKKWWYYGNFKYLKARYLLPFTNEKKYIPSFLKGKSKGLFGVAKKIK